MLDQIESGYDLPVTTPTMHLATKLWIEKRNGKAKGDPKRHPKLDAKVIITAQAIEKSDRRQPLVIATKNLKDFFSNPQGFSARMGQHLKGNYQ